MTYTSDRCLKDSSEKEDNNSALEQVRFNVEFILLHTRCIFFDKLVNLTHDTELMMVSTF